jgi:hypothetical protein
MRGSEVETTKSKEGGYNLISEKCVLTMRSIIVEDPG